MTTPREARAIGIYGGTFNPVHIGHLRAAEEVAELLGLERVLFVPSGQPPHKDGSQLHPVAPAALRLDWVRAAVAGNPRFAVSTVEVERAGPSYLVDTLTELRSAFAPARLVFILGRDAFQELGGWREPKRLLTLADFAVTTRPPAMPENGGLAPWLPECARSDFALARDGLSATHREAGTTVRLVGISALDVSATDVRARVRDGRSIRYLVPEAVRRSVVRSGVYAAAPQSVR